jgi:hypothetical protein
MLLIKDFKQVLLCAAQNDSKQKAHKKYSNNWFSGDIQKLTSKCSEMHR